MRMALLRGAWCVLRLFLLTRGRIVLGEPGPPPAARGPAPVGPPAPPPAVGPRVLGLAVALLGRLEGRPGHRLPGHGRRLAPPGVPPVLALEVARPARAAAHRPRGPPA